MFPINKNNTILETDRMYLRPYIEDDLERLAEIYSDEDVMRYIGRGGVISKEQTMKGIDTWRSKLYQEYGFGIWALIEKESDILIGHCGFNRLPQNAGVEIAYLLAKDFWGKGLATEISRETLKFGFEKLHLDRIVALAYPQNIPSINVIKKLGLKSEGEKVFFEKTFLFFGIDKADMV